MTHGRKLDLRHQQVLIHNSSQEIGKLYSWWENLPSVASIGSLDHWSGESLDIRLDIITILSEPVKEVYQSNSLSRYVRHPREILYILNHHYSYDFKLPNLYFHLEALKKRKMIVPVASLSDGRYQLTYYGRAARKFLFTTSNNELDQVVSDLKGVASDVRSLLDMLGSSPEKEKVEMILQDFIGSRTVHDMQIMTFLESYGEDLASRGVDIARLFVFLSYTFTTPALERLLSPVRKSMKKSSK